MIRLALFFKLREHGWPWQDPLSPRGTVHAGVTIIAAPRGIVHARVTVVFAPKVQPRWCNGCSRTHWEKNPTCLASMSTFSSFRSSSLPSTTGATYHQILVRCDLSTSPARHTEKNQRFTIAELVFMHQVAQQLRWNATVVSKAF